MGPIEGRSLTLSRSSLSFLSVSLSSLSLSLSLQTHFSSRVSPLPSWSLFTIAYRFVCSHQPVKGSNLFPVRIFGSGAHFIFLCWIRYVESILVQNQYLHQRCLGIKSDHLYCSSLPSYLLVPGRSSCCRSFPPPPPSAECISNIGFQSDGWRTSFRVTKRIKTYVWCSYSCRFR
jgi:hypothetical protein